jgi:hypothetical protein
MEKPRNQHMSQINTVAKHHHHSWRIAIVLLLTASVRLGTLALPDGAWLATGVAGHGETRLTAGAWTSCWVEPVASDLPETPFFSPGLPGVLSVVQRCGIQANPDLCLRWIAVLLGCVAPLAAYCLIFSTGACPNRACAAGCLIAIDPLLVAATSFSVPAALTGSMVIFSLATALGTVRSGNWALAGLTGLSAAGASLLEARLLPWAIVLVSWTIFRLRLQTLGWMAMVSGSVAFLVPLATTYAGTAKHMGEPWPVSPSWGSYIAAGAEIDPRASEELPETETPIQRSKRLGKIALRQISHAPATWIAGRWKNIPTVLLGAESPAQIPERTGADSKSIGASGLGGWWLLVLPVLAGIGLVTLASGMGHGGLLTLSLLIMPLPWLLGPVTSDLSARIPLEPVLILLVALGVLNHPTDSSPAHQKPCP